MGASPEKLQKDARASDFIWNYVKPNNKGGIYNEEHFLDSAKVVKKLCKDALDEDGTVYYRSSCRAKSRERLQTKLIYCDEERTAKGQPKLACAQDVVDEIRDLAAIRIILYFPSERQRNKVRDIVIGKFGSKKPDFEETKHDPQSRLLKGIHDFQPRNLGYFADHYYVRIKKKMAHLVNSYKYSRGDRVEIQVLSAFGHACYEAEHDVGYKTIDGATTEHEQRILDSLHGLANTADVLIEQLHQLYLERTREQFGASHKLSKFLCDEIKSRGFLLAKEKRKKNFEDEAMALEARSMKMVSDIQQHGNFDLLYQFLKSQRYDTPSNVRKMLGELAIPEEDSQPGETLKYYASPGLSMPADVTFTICFIHHFLSQIKNTQVTKEAYSDEDSEACPDEGKTDEEEADEPDLSGNKAAALASIDRARTLTAAALCFSKFWDDNPNDVTFYIGRFGASVKERVALSFLFTDDTMPFILRGKPEDYQYVTDSNIRNARNIDVAWSWFEAQRQAANLCGLAFQAARLGLLVDRVQDSSYDASKLKSINVEYQEGHSPHESESSAEDLE